MPNNSRFNDPLKEATIAALERVIDPLIKLMLDASVTVQEFGQLLRQRAVQVAAKRVLEESGRESNSRIAIITGLPRTEVARLLKTKGASSRKRLGQHPARKILATWFDNPRFLSANGEPDVLPIFGKRRSFEKLVALHARGIPVRAMLDELVQIDAIETLSDQRVRAKSRNPIVRGSSSAAIAMLGDRTRDLLETLIGNLRCPSNPLFEATALVENADVDMVSLVRREIAQQGGALINGANALFNRTGIKLTRQSIAPSAKYRLGVTVYYFQDRTEGARAPNSGMARGRRKNLKRQRVPTLKGQS